MEYTGNGVRLVPHAKQPHVRDRLGYTGNERSPHADTSFIRGARFVVSQGPLTVDGCVRSPMRFGSETQSSA